MHVYNYVIQVNLKVEIFGYHIFYVTVLLSFSTKSKIIYMDVKNKKYF